MIFKHTAVLKHDELPELEPGCGRYIVAKSGLYLECHDELFHACSRIKKFWDELDVPLLEQEEFFVPTFAKIPGELVEQMLGFFEAANKLHDGEAALVILYNPDTGEYRWHCPKQVVELKQWSKDGDWYTGDTIQFDNPLEVPEGFLHFGDAHLHPHGGVHASHIDKVDDQDGLHIIVSRNKWQTNEWEYGATFVMGKNRFEVPPSALIDGYDDFIYDCAEFPDEWMGMLFTQKVPYTPYVWSTWRKDGDGNGKKGKTKIGGGKDDSLATTYKPLDESGNSNGNGNGLDDYNESNWNFLG